MRSNFENHSCKITEIDETGETVKSQAVKQLELQAKMGIFIMEVMEF